MLKNKKTTKQNWQLFFLLLFFIFTQQTQLRNQSDANIHHIVNGNVHVCNQISQLIHGTNYPQRHDKVKVLKTCINNVLELLRMYVLTKLEKEKKVFLEISVNTKPSTYSCSSLVKIRYICSRFLFLMSFSAYLSKKIK